MKKVSEDTSPNNKKGGVLYKGSGNIEREIMELKELCKRNQENFIYWQEEIERSRKELTQRINRLESCIVVKKGNGRRDYSELTQDVIDYIAKRIGTYKEHQRASLSYKDVMQILKLPHAPAAYRIMEKTSVLYPDWMLYKNNGEKKLLVPTHEFALHVKETHGNIWSKVDKNFFT